MAHNILGNRCLVTSREPAWHGIGQSYTGPKTAVEAVAESGAKDVEIETREMGYRTHDGTFTPVEDRVVIVRKPIPEDPREVRLGEAGKGYTLLQNTEIAQLLDDSTLTTRWPVETCGVLGKGEIIFICLDMGGASLAGEDHRRYALFTDNRDGGSSLQVLTTWTRVVCQNTLNIALGNGQVKLNLQHTSTIGSDFRLSLDVMDQVEASSAQVKTSLEALATIRLRAEDMGEVWSRTYPDPTRGTLLRSYDQIDDPSKFDAATLVRLEKLQERYQDDMRRQSIIRDVAIERYDVLCQEFPIHAGTALGAFNTVCEVADHTRNSQKGSGAALFGTRADEKLRAYKYLSTLA